MVRNKKLITLSLLVSLIVTPSISAISLSEVTQSGSRMEVEEFSRLDLDDCTMLFDSSHVRTDGLSESLRLGADKDGFFVKAGEEYVRVKTCDTDEKFKDRSLNEIAMYGMTSKFKVSQFDNGEYKVVAAEGLNGGGLGGAWLGSYIAGGLVAGLGHGTIAFVGWCTGPAAPATIGTLEFWFGPSIQAAALAAACAGGIAGGVATGPV